MLRFECDYNASAHGRILRRLCEDGNRYPGYGTDELCAEASRKIRAAFSCPDAEIHYLVGGTQTNQIVADCLLDSCQGVVAAATGHVSVHEAGAVEYTGHKVLQIEGVEGKVVPARLENYLKGFFADVNHEHMVFPGMVYISHPTEYGTLYSLGELTQLSRICREYEIPLYMDGARLGYGLMSGHTDVTAADVARLTDVFYIGGTKVGALFGEALVFPRGNAPAHFMTTV